MLRPARLTAGDVVGLVDPASATWERIDVDIVEDTLTALGLVAKRGAHLLDRRGSLAGSDRDSRRRRDGDVHGSLGEGGAPVRGGWGCAHPAASRLRRHQAEPQGPDGVFGPSALLLAIHARTGLVTFHGPNGASEWNPTSADFFTRVVLKAEAVTFTNPRDKGETLAPDGVPASRRSHPARPAGALLGGNLSVLTALLGSPYLPDFRDAILFLEDVNEAPYRIDRMLTQLALAGVLKAARGVIWGTCRECEPDAGFGSLTIPDLLDDHVKPLGACGVAGRLVGYIDRQFTLPIGADVEIDATAGRSAC